MTTLGIAALKAELSQQLERVKAGGEIVITERGLPIARIVPIAGARALDGRVEELVRRDAVRLPARKLSPAQLRDLLAAPRPHVESPELRRALEQEREDRA